MTTRNEVIKVLHSIGKSKLAVSYASIIKASLDDRTLDQLVQMAAESAELDNPRDAEATPEVKREAKKFEAAVEKALEGWVKKHPLKEGFDADDLMDEEGAYLVLMTLRGEGVGIWDGRWDEFFNDPKKDIKELDKYLARALGKFADSTGGGSLEQLFEEAAFKTAAPERYAEEFDSSARGPRDGSGPNPECPLKTKDDDMEAKYTAEGPLEKMIGEISQQSAGAWLDEATMKAIVKELAGKGITAEDLDEDASYDDITEITMKHISDKDLVGKDDEAKGKQALSLPPDVREAWDQLQSAKNNRYPSGTISRLWNEFAQLAKKSGINPMSVSGAKAILAYAKKLAVVATLKKAGRTDLAKSFVQAQPR